MTEFEENLSELSSDSLDADIPSIDPEFAAYIDTRRLELPSPEAEAVGGSRIENGHKLVVDGLNIEHIYELEPRKINGVVYFEYGINATRNAKPPSGFLLHHTSDAAFENMMNYIVRRDDDRGGSFGYHFLVSRDGRVVQAAPLTKRTNHVSSTSSRTEQLHLNNANTISLSLHGGYKKVSGNAIHVPPTLAQLDAAEKIVSVLASELYVSITQSWGHGEVQSNRMREEALALSTRLRSTPAFA